MIAVKARLTDSRISDSFVSPNGFYSFICLKCDIGCFKNRLSVDPIPYKPMDPIVRTIQNQPFFAGKKGKPVLTVSEDFHTRVEKRNFCLFSGGSSISSDVSTNWHLMLRKASQVSTIQPSACRHLQELPLIKSGRLTS